jgi:NAD(P)-dependent dehydrogenase (short-subunit alcohol dehydrogenase family)
LITGSSTGIGQTITIRFAREGANVAINYLKGHDEAEMTEKLVQHACQSNREAGCKDLVVQADDASYITGQTIYACGGLTLYPDFRKPWSSGE